MNVLKPLSFDEAQSETQEIFTALKSKVGMNRHLKMASHWKGSMRWQD
ncbi:MAG: hypothetical protein JKY19_00640 [Alcanivoracaceae bacterium]|nr:hypothetical protein [Alcanivoracaceae bacterium]